MWSDEAGIGAGRWGLDGGYYGNELTMLKLWLYYHLWCSPPPGLLTDYAQHTSSISQSHQQCNSKIRIWTEYYIDISVQILYTHTQISTVLGEGLNGDFYCTGSYERVL